MGLSPRERPSLESVLRNSPFASSELSPDQIEQQTDLFLTMFGLAVETDSLQEEEWAYNKMVSAFSELMGHPPPDPERPGPVGLFTAMEWAARLRTVRDRAAREAAARA